MTLSAIQEFLASPGVAALIGALIGALAGVAGAWSSTRSAERQQRRDLSVRVALANWEHRLAFASKRGEKVLDAVDYVASLAPTVDRLLEARKLTKEEVLAILRESYDMGIAVAKLAHEYPKEQFARAVQELENARKGPGEAAPGSGPGSA